MIHKGLLSHCLNEADIQAENLEPLDLQKKLDESAEKLDDMTKQLEQATQNLESSNQKYQETHDRMLRIAAEFDNARKRWEREKAEVRQYSIQDFAKDLLPVIDAFEKALPLIRSAGEEEEKMAPMVEGIEMVTRVFEETLKKHGIEKVPGCDKPFDPRFHQAVAQVVDPTIQSEMVVEEFCPGYKIGERVLRTGIVKVAVPGPA